jgi:hypothetical protein
VAGVIRMEEELYYETRFCGNANSDGLRRRIYA